jgi:hypothetical protein
MDWPTQIAERRIREAMERGRFDDSPLKGTKLVFKMNPYVPEELRLAYKLLKDAGFLPREMELRKEIWTLKEMLCTIDDERERTRVADQINDRVLRLNVLWERSFSNEDRQVYGQKLLGKLA